MDIKKVLYVVSTMGLAVMLLLSVAFILGEQVPHWGVLAFGGLFGYVVGKDIDKPKPEFLTRDDLKKTSSETDNVMQELKAAIDERFEKEKA